jgi:hypothetical protein
MAGRLTRLSMSLRRGEGTVCGAKMRDDRCTKPATTLITLNCETDDHEDHRICCLFHAMRVADLMRGSTPVWCVACQAVGVLSPMRLVSDAPTRVLHRGSNCCDVCWDENPAQFVAFPTLCPHRSFADTSVTNEVEGGQNDG